MIGQAEPNAELAEDLVIRPRFADRGDHRLHELQVIGAVALRDVVVLEERRRRQHDVGVHRGVGHHLLEDDGEQIVALEALAHAILIGHGRERIAVVDEQHRDRRVLVLGQRPAEMVHVHDARRRRGTSISFSAVMPHAPELLIV